MFRKILTGLVIAFVFSFVACMAITTYSFVNSPDVLKQAKYDGVIISSGITLIGVIVTVWTGLNIVQVLEKRELKMIEEEIGAVSKERLEIYKSLLYQNLRTTDDFMNQYLIELLQLNEDRLNAELCYDLNILELYFMKLYKAHYDNQDIPEKEEVIEYSEHLVVKYCKEKWQEYYLQFRLGEIYFYAGYKCKDIKRKIDYMQEAYNAYQKVIIIKENGNIKRNKLIHNTAQMIYMLNTLGNCCDALGCAYLKRNEVAMDKAYGKEYLDKAKDCFEIIDTLYASESNIKKREVYIRSYGIVMEHCYVNGIKEYNAYEILNKYTEAVIFSIREDKISRNALYAWLSFYKRQKTNIPSEYVREELQRALTFSRLAVECFPNEAVFRKLELFALIDLYSVCSISLKEQVKKAIDQKWYYLHHLFGLDTCLWDDYMREIREQYQIINRVNTEQ